MKNFIFGATIMYAIFITIGGVAAAKALEAKMEETPETKEEE